MSNEDKTKEQLLSEVTELKQQIAYLEKTADNARTSERLLRMSERSFRMLFERAPLCYQLLDSDAHILNVNKAWLNTLGYSREEVLGRWLGDFMTPQSMRHISEYLTNFKATGDIHDAELEMVRKDGQRCTMSCHGTIGYEEQANFTHAHCILADITERKRIEDKLIYVMKAVESSSDAIGISDSQGHHFYQNKAFSDLYGYATAEELEAVGGGAATVKNLEVAREMYDNIMNGKSWAGELEVVTKSGRVFTAFERADAIKDNDGNLIGLIGIITDITERKKAEEALLYFQMAVGSATDAIGMSTPEGRHYYQNEAFTKLFGLSVSEVNGGSGPPTTVYADAEVGRKVFDIIMKGGTFAGEIKMLDKNRNEKDIYLRAYPIKNKEGRIVGLVGVHTDITDRKKSEEKLRKSEQRLVESQEVARLANWDLNLVSQELEWSEETYKLFDKSSEVFKPSFNEFARLVHHDDLETMQTNFDNALKSDDNPYHVEVRIINDSGREWVMEAFGRVRRDSSGKALSIFGTAQDITERKKAEEKIHNSEEFIRNILDTVDEGFIVVDRDFKILSANRAYCLQTGTFMENVIGRHCYEISHRTLRPCHEEGEDCAVRHVLETGEPHTALHKHPDAKGSVLYVETKAFPIKDSTGAVASVIETVNNISEKQLLEEERLKTQKLEAIGTLAGGIAHDFNNLLQGVFGYMSMAKMSLDQRETAASMLEQAEKALHQSVNLTTQLLTFSKGGKPVKKAIALKPMIENAVKFALSGSRLDYRINIDKNLCRVEADEGQLGQVIQNIVLNAEQAMPMGGTITIKAKNISSREKGIPPSFKPGDYVEISIRDGGVGIPEQYLPKIFDPYFTTKEKGSGLGLATSYSIIKNHNGLIDVKSKPGEGTTFIVYLPAIAAAETSAVSVSEDVQALRKGRILLMDDDDIVRNIAEIMIRSLGHKAETAADGKEAIEKYHKSIKSGKQFDAVILDLTVRGGMGGEETIKELLAIDPNIRAIVSSGYTDSSTMAEYKKVGFKACLTKPYNIDSLNSTLNRLMN